MGLEGKVGISQSTISAVLHGTRSLTKEHMITFARLLSGRGRFFLEGGATAGMAGMFDSRRAG